VLHSVLRREFELHNPLDLDTELVALWYMNSTKPGRIHAIVPLYIQVGYSETNYYYSDLLGHIVTVLLIDTNRKASAYTFWNICWNICVMPPDGSGTPAIPVDILDIDLLRTFWFQ
jgi:hypothetical protein